ncbi:single-stranded DNA-binding protein [bacterium]|nr:MAG: single-stranded DNA-binding protein [bacterium]
MSASFNKFIAVGRLTRDPELRTLQSGSQVAKFTIAVDRRRNSNQEDRQTDFFDVTAWDRLAETCATYLKKGMLVLIDGRVELRRYEDREGVKRIAVDVIAGGMQMLSHPNNGASADGRRPDDGQGTSREDSLDDAIDDEIPF